MNEFPTTHDAIFGCVLYTRWLDKDGYPLARIDGRTVRLHRYLYAERHGQIPEGKEVEHRCRRRNCLADAHHALLTRSQQERAKSWASRSRNHFCEAKHGRLHAMVTPEGGVVCRVCSKGETR